MESNTIIKRVDADWVDVKNACRTTVNKAHTENVPGHEFKTKLLISEHSPIRLIRVRWLWPQVKSWVTVHFARHHVGVEKWIGTQRSDRVKEDRNNIGQGALIPMEMEANAQALINMSRVRLCQQASPETREHMENVKVRVFGAEPELSDVMVPNCIYRGGCPECFSDCSFWESFHKKYSPEEMSDIEKRYSAYNNFFWKGRGCH